MITKIKTVSDVKSYAAMLIDEDTAFHPDTDFNEYIVRTNGSPAYQNEEAKLRNKLMDECFTVCRKEGEDIYNIMMNVYLKETGLDNLFKIEN